MKTVMKKMFCLLLVAVLLVSAVPVAFAAEDNVKCPNGHDAVYSRDYTAATCTADQVVVYKCTKATAEECVWVGEFYYTVPNSKVSHTPGAAATCTTAQVCTVCWQQIAGSKGHTPGAAATCSAPQKCSVCQEEVAPKNPSNHTYSNGVCTGCGMCENCKKTTCECCTDCGMAPPNHADTCDTLYCDKDCGQKIHEGFCCTNCNVYGHHLSSCGELYETCCGVQKDTAHRTGCSFYCDKGRNCPNASIQNAAHKDGCEYNLCSDTQCTFEKGHGGNHSYECQLTQGCTRANGHGGACNPPADPNAVCANCNGGHETADCPNDGDYDLKIYATMWTGDGREETVYLGTFYNLSTNTKIADYMKENSNRIHNWVAAKCSGYGWNDGKIYEDKKSSDEIEWNDRIGYSDQEAFINVSRPSKDVVLFLHTARVYNDYDWIKVEGKTTDDTLTLDEAKSIVKKYYSFSSLKMYSNDDWNEYVDGNNNIKAQTSVEIGSGNVTKIHILMSGHSAKSSSGSGYTADSSNPKTGDDIFAPAMIMGLSASALAVVYFLNKKRAF